MLNDQKTSYFKQSRAKDNKTDTFYLIVGKREKKEIFNKVRTI